VKEAFEIVWAAVAERDLLGIVDSIAEDDPGIALEILHKIEVDTAKLDHSPRRGRIVPELLEQGISRYREIVISPWRVIYRAEEKKVYVVAVIDGRRNVEDILLARFLR
jgi:plasmid stabilization system protein ParE